MMDFLRRLAPPRATDATRAVALLPSRFADENPLQATIARSRPDQAPGDDQAAFLPDLAFPAAPDRPVAAQGPPITGVRPSRVTPRPLAGEPARSDDRRGEDIKTASPPFLPAGGKAVSRADAPAEASVTRVAKPRVVQARQGEHPGYAGPASPTRQAQQVLAVALAAPADRQFAAAPRAQDPVALPLSHTILAQRALQSRADSQEVHVTIGRIDVIANTAPVPAVRNSPAPRPPTVTLADYLSGNKAGHP